MPQIDLKYSADLTLDTDEIFQAIEALLGEMDASAGACKCRAYPATDFLQTHALLEVKVLPKAHRDELFMQGCLNQLETLMKTHLPEGCYLAIEVGFSGAFYLTTSV